jgi:hypothetical protein
MPPGHGPLGRLLVLLFAAALGGRLCSSAQPLSLATESGLTFRIDPATLAASIAARNEAWADVSAPLSGLGAVVDLGAGGGHASWRLPEAELKVSVTLTGRRARVSFTRAAPGSLGWPVVRPRQGTRGFVVPTFEGVYVRTDDPVLGRWLVGQGEMGATEGLSMPFLGVDLGARVLTYILPTPYYPTLTFTDAAPPTATFAGSQFTRRLLAPTALMIRAVA